MTAPHQRTSAGGQPADDEELRCYCFGITVADLRRDGAARIDFVERKIRAGECDCARKNPSGRCCLGDLHATVRLHRR